MLSKALPPFSGPRITMLTSALTFPIVSLQALLTVCPFLYLPIGMSLPSLMSRQVSLAGLPVSTCCTHSLHGKLSCFLGYIVLPSKKSQWPTDLSSPILTLSRFSPLPSSSPFDLSPPGLVFTPSLWLCQFFWFRCLFNLSRLIQSHHFLQEPTQSCVSPNMVYVPQIDINYLLVFLLP